ncbi:MAG: DUF655 domain-containing protein [Candidatus Heimdallarchaeota archaeon]|nr:DUF655 domain-containing protein [Candidatus Heimdallarchaeota archaeon]MDH5645153.1 DUF655 domain-containing protein [Candidatus Heimdallarchaeota archaeon]
MIIISFNQRRPRRHSSDKRPQSHKRYEELGIVLDVIMPEQNRRKDKFKDEPIVIIIGTEWFTILELVPEDPNEIMLHDEIVLNKENDSTIKAIIGRIPFDKLTSFEENQLEKAINIILDKKEKRFVTWLNQASPISIRKHSLHLIKGIGPKSLEIILNERKIMPFISFEDFNERTRIKDIKQLLVNRILDEISNEDEKHHLFTRPMKRDR